jgi:predicted nucleic acid-binding protein
MKCLVDTNIFLEILLDQYQTQSAKEFLSRADEHDLYISDYSLHSIGLLLFRRKEYDAFQEFVDDMLIRGNVGVATLPVDRFMGVGAAAKKYNLDFDDAYQYAIAENEDYAIVSFDADFDRTDRGRLTPSAVSSN